MAQYMRVLSRPVSNCKLKNEHVLEMNDHGLFVTRPFYFCAPLSAINKLCCILPLAGAVFCLVWTLLFDFEESTKTHCNVIMQSYYYLRHVAMLNVIIIETQCLQLKNECIFTLVEFCNISFKSIVVNCFNEWLC